MDTLDTAPNGNPRRTPASGAQALRECRWREADRETSYHALSKRLRALSETAHLEGNDAEAAALKLLAALCDMRLDSVSGDGPFHPAIVMNGRRTLLPEDLSEVEVAGVAALSKEADVPPLLRARLADVAWLTARPREPEHARAAIDAYRASPLTSAHWFDGGREELFRAIQLCRELGRDCLERLAAIEVVLLEFVLRGPTDSAGVLKATANMLARSGMGRDQRLEIASRLQRMAGEVEQPGDWHSPRELHLEAANWFALAGKEEDAARERSRAADMWIREAEFYESRGGTGYMLAAAPYEAAVQLLRSIPRKHRGSLNVDTIISELRRRIRENNQRSVDMMESFSGEPVDIREMVESSRRAVAAKDPWQALSAFVRFTRPPAPVRLREEAEASMKEFPLQTLFSSARFSSDGRLVARSPGLNVGEKNSAAWEQAVNERAVQNLTMYQSLVVQGGILPALDVMNLEHRFTEGDFIALADRSPLVPRGRERMVGRGLCAGFRRDFAVAVHLLAPQLEHIVRVHVVAAGGETRTLDASGLECEIGLGALVGLPQVERVFGATLAFELRAVFCDAAGSNLRNNVAHGLLDDDEMVSAASVYAWWFCLRLVMLPLLEKAGADVRAAGESPSMSGAEDAPEPSSAQ